MGTNNIFASCSSIILAYGQDRTEAFNASECMPSSWFIPSVLCCSNSQQAGSILRAITAEDPSGTYLAHMGQILNAIAVTIPQLQTLICF